MALQSRVNKPAKPSTDSKGYLHSRGIVHRDLKPGAGAEGYLSR